MRLIRDDLDQFSRLVAATADAIGLDPSLVEKDYWAVEALRAVHVGFPVDIDGIEAHIRPIFKGGTSLSKAYGLIQRFSEDVDLLVPIPVDGPTTYSQNQRTDVLRAATDAVSAALEITGERTGGRRGVDRHWLYPYNPIGSGSELVGIVPSIRVEATVMGGQNPRELRPVIALAADHAATLTGLPAYDDLTPVDIETLAPERTLVEKLAMVHDSAQQAIDGETGRFQGAGRHFYDIAMLLQSETVVNRLSSTWVADTAADADHWSAMGKYPFTPRPEAGFASSPAFRDQSLESVITPSYEAALSWVWGERPTLAESRSSRLTPTFSDVGPTCDPKLNSQLSPPGPSGRAGLRLIRPDRAADGRIGRGSAPPTRGQASAAAP